MDKILAPKLSVVIPIHDMKGGADFLWKSINMLCEQTFQDFEIIITKKGGMAENTNEGIKRARGEIIKILYLDDVLATKDALERIVERFTGGWMIHGVDNNPYPYWTDDIKTGNNKLGSPSALVFENKDPLLFDESMTWLLDCELYTRLFERYGEPDIIDGVFVNIGVGDHQMTNIISDDIKVAELNYLNEL